MHTPYLQIRVTLDDLMWSYRLSLLKDHGPICLDDKSKVSEFSDKIYEMSRVSVLRRFTM